MCGFLFVFHSSYGRIFNFLWDIQRHSSVTLKTWLVVVQGHWKWRRSIDHNATFYRKYSSICYRFWVIWRSVISWPWNLGLRSLKIIQNGTIRKLGCGFLFAFLAFYSNYSHQFRDIARYWSKIVIFSYPFTFDAPVQRVPVGILHPVWYGLRNKNLAIANRSCVSCAQNSSRASIGLITHDLEILVKGHSRSLETEPLDRSYTTYY